MALVINTLSNIEQTLVVIDNANDMEDIVLYRQLFTHSNCHFLLTSRVKPEGWKTVSVESLPIDLAISFFKTHYKKTKEEGIPDKKIENLVQKLFRHTLLIELIAKAARKRNMPFEKLEKIIEDRWIQDPELNKVGIDTGEHGDTLTVNLKRAKVNEYIFFIFENIAAIPEKHQEMLKAFALLPLAEEMDETALETLFNTLSIDFDLDELEQISEAGWLQKNRETQHFSLHPLIAEIVMEKLNLSVDWAAPYIEAVSNLIYYDAQNPQHDLSEKNTFRSYAERLKDLFFNKNSLGFAELLDDLGTLDYNYGFYINSKILRERALEIAIALLDSKQEMISRFQSNLALALQDLGDYKGAKDLLEKAIKSDEKNFEKDHPRIAIRYSNLASVLQKLGDYEGAKELLEKTIKSAEQNFGKDHPMTATYYSNLATVLQSLSDYDGAKKLLEKTIKSAEQNFGKDHPSTALRYWKLATVLKNLKNSKGAYQYGVISLEIFKKVLPKTHPHIKSVSDFLKSFEK